MLDLDHADSSAAKRGYRKAANLTTILGASLHACSWRNEAEHATAQGPKGIDVAQPESNRTKAWEEAALALRPQHPLRCPTLQAHVMPARNLAEQQELDRHILHHRTRYHQACIGQTAAKIDDEVNRPNALS